MLLLLPRLFRIVELMKFSPSLLFISLNSDDERDGMIVELGKGERESTTHSSRKKRGSSRLKFCTRQAPTSMRPRMNLL